MWRLLACGTLAVLSLVVQAPAPQRVLFIGNSLTAANGLAGMVEALAREAGDPPIETRTVAVGGYSLQDHWEQGDARKILANGRWTTVVLQQGPSTQPDSEVLLRDYVRRFDRAARQVGAATAVFMAWPPRAGPGTFSDSSRSYRHANDDIHGLLLPVGDAYRVALEHDPAFPVLGSDGFHPTPLGSYLAALVIHRGLSGRSEPCVPASIAAAGVRPPGRTLDATLTLLKVAAAVR
jgi:hypothetical protein